MTKTVTVSALVFLLLARVFHRTEASVLTSRDVASDSPSCRFIPGDAGWPTVKEWSKLNATIHGRLIETIPAGHVCHDPTYDAEACAALNQTWAFPQAQFNDPAGFMSAYHQNGSCDPYTLRSSPCLQGNYVSYAINISSAADAIAGIRFAQEKNVRLVIKNTGHDYLGKSTGKGALSLWTHNLNSIGFLNYSSDSYTGPAIKMGAGVQAFAAYEAASKVGLQVVGGECPTVGIAGGYSQGGGHSMLSSKYGMGADQALEWEVVTANGTLVTATPTQNSDLYWALSGGGGGTYGLVLSLTAKAYPDSQTGGASLSFSAPLEQLFEAVFVWQLNLPAIVDAGARMSWFIMQGAFLMNELTIPDKSENEVRELLSPFTNYLDQRGIQYQLNASSFPTFYEHAERYIGPLPYGSIPAAQIQGGVMFSRETVLAHNDDLINIIRNISNTTSFLVASIALNVSSPLSPPAPNAVLPAWRDALLYYVIGQFWNFTAPAGHMDAQHKMISDELMPPLQNLASGAYLSEADWRNPRWKEEFYGENYEKLVEIKKKWDRNGLWWVETGVGSDKWTVDEKGRICKVRGHR